MAVQGTRDSSHLRQAAHNEDLVTRLCMLVLPPWRETEEVYMGFDQMVINLIVQIGEKDNCAGC